MKVISILFLALFVLSAEAFAASRYSCVPVSAIDYSAGAPAFRALRSGDAWGPFELNINADGSVQDGISNLVAGNRTECALPQKDERIFSGRDGADSYAYLIPEEAFQDAKSIRVGLIIDDDNDGTICHGAVFTCVRN